MALTIGTAPFGTDPGGVLNATVEGPERVIWWEDHPRRVRVTLGGEVVAESSRMKLLHETGELPVYYFPEEDVRSELLEPSESHTECPYKGRASYRSVRVRGVLHEDLVWCYPQALPEATKVQGLLCFYNERVDLEVDGEAWDRPVTKFS